MASQRGKILIIDDDPLIGGAIKAVLSKDHDPVFIASAQDALTLLSSEHSFQLILCDLMMPGLDGIGFYEALALAQPGQENKIIFMTGGTFTKRGETFLKKITNLTVGKPLELKLLRKIITDRLAQISVVK